MNRGDTLTVQIQLLRCPDVGVLPNSELSPNLNYPYVYVSCSKFFKKMPHYSKGPQQGSGGAFAGVWHIVYTMYNVCVCVCLCSCVCLLTLWLGR